MRSLLSLGFAVVLLGAASAQQKGKGETRGTDPLWVMAGQTAAVRLFGNDLTGVTEIKFEDAGFTGTVVKTEQPADKKRGNSIVEVSVTTSAAAQPRPYRFTLLGSGEPVPGRLLVDVLAPDVPEMEPNNDLRKPQVLPGPATINGKLEDGVDVFRIDGKAGETWRFEVFSRRLKADSKLEAVIRLRDPRLAPVRAVVDQGEDCSLEYKLLQDGPYLIELFDGDNKTGGGMDYRLTVRKF